MRCVRTFLLGVSLLLWTSASPSHAQPTNHCSEILKYGVFDTSLTSYTNSYAGVFLDATCKVASRNKSAAGEGSYGAYWGSGSWDEDRFDETCSKVYEKESLDTTEFEAIKTASQAIVAAWSNCLTDGSFGSRFSLEQKSDRKTVRGSLFYRSSASPVLTTDMWKGSIVLPESVADCKSLSENRVEVSDGTLRFEVNSGEQVMFECKRTSPSEIEFPNPISNQANTQKASLFGFDTTKRIVMEADRLVKPGVCSGANEQRIDAPVFGFTVWNATLDELTPITVTSVGADPLTHPSSTEVDTKSFDCDSNGRCEFRLEPIPPRTEIVMTGRRAKGGGDGLWIRFPASLGGSYQLVSVTGRRECDPNPAKESWARVRTPFVRFVFQLRSTWTP